MEDQIEVVTLNEQQKALLAALLHHALVEIRQVGWQGNAVQAADLADAVESLPNEMLNGWAFSWESLISSMAKYQAKYSSDFAYNYVAEIQKIRRVK